ncbi:MAG: DMT family transporter [Hyphomicrobiales bacterium]|nr:MAG: DMT family transporter [Hyphomicrobiales bacterium]
MPSDTTAPRHDVRQLTWLGLALAIAGAAFFATKGIVIKLALAEGIDSITTLTWRMIVAVPIFLTVGILGYRRKVAALPPGAPPVLDRRTLLQTVGVGVLGYYVSSFLDFQALEYISAQFDRLILLTYPFFVVLFGMIFFKRKVTPLMVGAMLTSYLGIAVIFWRDFSFEGSDVLLGATLVFIASITYAAYQILAKPLIDRMGAQLFTSIAMSGAGPAVILHFLFTHPVSDLAVSGNGLMMMLAIGTVSTVLPAYCISGAIGLIGPERTSVIGNVSPVVTITLAVFVLGESFTVWHAAGTVLVLAGAWLFTRKQKVKRAEVEAAEA